MTIVFAKIQKGKKKTKPKKKRKKKAQTAKGIEEQMQISWAATFGVCERVHANKWRGYTFLYTWLENDKKNPKKQDNCWTGHLPIKPKSKCVIEKKKKKKHTTEKNQPDVI